MSNRSIGKFHPPESFKFQKPRLVQRLRMLSNDNQVKFGDRFAFDYMGASEFEQGLLGQCIRRMNSSCQVGQIMISGRDGLAAWDPDYYNLEGAEFVINRIWDDSLRLKERAEFNQLSYDRWKREVKEMRENPLARNLSFMTDSWFEIEYGLFWTWKKCNINDIRLNFRKSVAYMDAKKESA